MTNNAFPFPVPGQIQFDDSAKAKEFIGASANDSIQVQAIARPKNEEEVQSLVEWANQNKVNLVPLSSPGGVRRKGLAGIGSKPFVVVDLSRMSRVIHADSEDGIAVIEPGVTFPEFEAQLNKKGLRAIKPFMPRRTKSVLSCFLEREPTTVPNDHWDTTDPLACLSLVMGNGETFRTGGAAVYENLDDALKNGMRQMMSIGPIGTDYSRVMLGSQGTLGITCWASIYCERAPKLEKGHIYGSNEIQDALALVRHLALHQLGAQYFVLSRIQLAAALAESNEHFEGLAANKEIPAWCVYVNIAAPDFLPEEGMKWQLADLGAFVDTTSLQLVSDKQPELLNSLEARQKDLPELFYKDVPKGTHTDVFCLAQLSNVTTLVSAAEEVLAAAEDISFGVYLQPTVQGATCHVEIVLFHSEEQRQALTAIEAKLVKALADKGGFFSRPYGDWAEDAFQRNSGIVPHLQKVKDMFDPAGVLSPGKLCY